jgi:hypothetical protein
LPGPREVVEVDSKTQRAGVIGFPPNDLHPVD